MKKIFASLICLVMVFGVTACGKQNNTSSNTNAGNMKGNCAAVECIKKIDITSSLSDVNKIMGFEGKLTNEKLNVYTWEISSEQSVEVTFDSNKKASVKIVFPKENVQNSKVDLSNYDEIKTLLRSGKLDYSTFVKKVGNVEGVLVEKSSYSKKYLWYNSRTKYLYGTFSESSGRCTFISGLNN